MREYERPELNRVGDAEDVILGIMGNGGDIDSMFMPSGMEWAEDSED